MKLPFVEKVKARKEAAREKKAKEQFKRLYIATHPIDFSNITEFRNDAFPESGPSCWLDRPNALMEIERKERDREITAACGGGHYCRARKPRTRRLLPRAKT